MTTRQPRETPRPRVAERASPLVPPSANSPVAAPPGPAGPAKPRQPSALKEEVRKLLLALRSTPQSAEEAFRGLWEVDAELIPDLLLEIERPEASQLRELKILIPDCDEFARRNVGLNSRGDGLSYEVPGMGTVQYDDLATGPARGRGLRIVLKRFNTAASGAFTVGEVIRAAMLNRFQSSDYPPGDHRSGLVSWWQRYYERVRSSL